VRQQRLAHGVIEGIYRNPRPSAAVCITASPTRSWIMACAFRSAAALPLDDHREPEQLERRPIIRGGAPHQHLERPIRRFELQPRVLQPLDMLQQLLVVSAVAGSQA